MFWTSKVDAEARLLDALKRAAADMLKTLDGQPDIRRLQEVIKPVDNLMDSYEYPELSDKWEKAHHQITNFEQRAITADGLKSKMLAQTREAFLSDSACDIAYDRDAQGQFEAFADDKIERNCDTLREWAHKIYKTPELMRDPAERRQMNQDLGTVSTDLRNMERVYRMFSLEMHPGWAPVPCAISAPAAAFAKWNLEETQIVSDGVNKLLGCCYNLQQHMQAQAAEGNSKMAGARSM